MRAFLVLRMGAAMVVVGAGVAWASAACFQDARANFQSCLSQCKSDLVAARLTCRNVNTACGEACLAGRQACLDNVQTILQTGQLPDGSPLANCSGGTDECKATFKAARQACGVPCQPADTECADCVDNAQIADLQCRDACRDSWRSNPTVITMLQSCQGAFKACVRQCPPAAATTTTTVP